MTTPRCRRPKARLTTKAAPDPKLLMQKLRARLDKERAGLDRCQKRLVRTFHAYERQLRLTTRIARRIAKLESV